MNPASGADSNGGGCRQADVRAAIPLHSPLSASPSLSTASALIGIPFAQHGFRRRLRKPGARHFVGIASGKICALSARASGSDRPARSF